MTEDDINKIIDGVLAKVGGKVWGYKLGNIVTAEMDEAGDIMRAGAKAADTAAKQTKP